MRAVNIYALTRMLDEKLLAKYEKHLSGREYSLRIRSWEILGLRDLAELLCEEDGTYDRLSFFYSFQIPKLGKELDLLQITRDRVVNIELKSQAVSEEKLKKQLLLNRHYLSSLGKHVYLYTYVSSKNLLFRLTNGDRLVECKVSELRGILSPLCDCITENIESLFSEERYMISPLTEPDRFLRRDYFLTSQQRDIRGKILADIARGNLFQGYCGLPGTGKTLLLFDIAMQLSVKQRVAVLHFGNSSEELNRLQKILKRVELYALETLEEHTEAFWKHLAQYACVCVDEGQRMSEEFLRHLVDFAKENSCPVVISYVYEEVLSPEERESNVAERLSELPEYVAYRLTNRIRANAQLSNFIQNLVNLKKGRRRGPFPLVEMTYAGNREELGWMLEHYEKQGYQYLPLPPVSMDTEGANGKQERLENKDYPKVVMVMDSRFAYDEKGYLRETSQKDNTHSVARLFHGLNRATGALAMVVFDNPALFREILFILQGEIS